MSESRAPLVWLDMEMTGLDPEVCVPLQVAMVITDPELKELDSVEVTIWQPEEKLSLMEPFVQQMHAHNGLTKAVRRSDQSLRDAEKALLSMLARWCPPGTGILCGNSIHQDRRFLAAYFPVVHGYLHYRMVDVSTLKELGERWYGSDVLYKKGSTAHTALADVRESIAELRHYRGSMFKAP